MLAGFEQTIKATVENYGLLAVYVTMTLESACIPIPSEVVMPYAGHLAAKGHFGLAIATLVGSLANLTGSWIAYLVGRYGGRDFINKYGKYIFLSHKHLQMADNWFENKGEITVFVSRMLPAVRTFISLPAGITRMNFAKFSIYSFFGALPWNFMLAYLGYIFTDNWSLLQKYLHQFNIIIAILAIPIIALAFYFIRKNKRKF